MQRVSEAPQTITQRALALPGLLPSADDHLLSTLEYAVPPHIRAAGLGRVTGRDRVGRDTCNTQVQSSGLLSGKAVRHAWDG